MTGTFEFKSKGKNIEVLFTTVNGDKQYFWAELLEPGTPEHAFILSVILAHKRAKQHEK